MDKEFNLTFAEAMSVLFQKKGFIVGEGFQKGVFVSVDDIGIVVVKERGSGIGYNTLCNLYITKGILDMKYKLIVAASDKELGLIE